MLINNRMFGSQLRGNQFGLGAPNLYPVQIIKQPPALLALGGGVPDSAAAPAGYTTNFLWIPVSASGPVDIPKNISYTVTIANSLTKNTSKSLSNTITMVMSQTKAMTSTLSYTISGAVTKNLAMMKSLNCSVTISQISIKDTGKSFQSSAGTTLSRFIDVGKSITNSISIEIGLFKDIAQQVLFSSSVATEVIKTIPKTVAYGLSSSTERIKDIGKILGFSQGLSYSRLLNVIKGFSYDISIDQTINKSIVKALLHLSNITLEFSRSLSIFLALAYSSVTSISMSKALSISLSLDYSITTDLSRISEIYKVLSYVIDSSVTINKGYGKVFNYLCNLDFNFEKGVFVNLVYGLDTNLKGFIKTTVDFVGDRILRPVSNRLSYAKSRISIIYTNTSIRINSKVQSNRILKAFNKRTVNNDPGNL